MKTGLGNKIIPFKGRRISLSKRVRNLHAKNVSKKFSVQQGGLVVGHTCQLMLQECEFVVNQAGLYKTRDTKQKVVHAFIVGKIARRGAMGITAKDYKGMTPKFPARISYNPYEDDYFMCKNLTTEGYAVTSAEAVVITRQGVSAAYTN